jgi:hypothetical protein
VVLKRTVVVLVAFVTVASASLTAVALARRSKPTRAKTSHGALFKVGAAVVSYTPPAAGTLKSDPADCEPALDGEFNGKRYFAFEEPYIDENHVGYYQLGDPYIDCDHAGRWQGDTLGGGGNSPRFYDHVADPVGARAVVISNGTQTVALEVVDNEGLFNTYSARIRAAVAAAGIHIDNMQISSTHDESAPDTIGLGGINSATSGVNQYFAAYLVQQSALAIEQAYRSMRPAHIRYAQAEEPANLIQCWSSYPFIDNQMMPVLQAVGTDGKVIATIGDVSQHDESLGFNSGSQDDPGAPTPTTLNQENLWVTADWVYWFRRALETRYGGVGIEMAGSVGSSEIPEVFNKAIPRTPEKYVVASHPAGCRTLWTPPAGAKEVPLGYYSETRALGQDLAGAVESALTHGSAWSKTNTMWAQTVNICIPLQNVLFKAAAYAGVFAERTGYTGADCSPSEAVPPAPNGTTGGNYIQSQAAAWQIGDAEFIGAPGEVFPFTFLRGPVGPEDMNYPDYPMPPWPIPYMHTPWRFFDGLDNDMIGYIFPQGNNAGIPGTHVTTNPTASGTDRFGCGHSDDSESVADTAGNIIGAALVQILQSHLGPPESIVQGRFVLPGGKLSRNPLGTTDTIKCTAPVDTTFVATGPAVAVWEPGKGVIRPYEWMNLLGRPQSTPDRNTRGYMDRNGTRHWLDVFPDISGQPASVTVPKSHK